MDGAERLCALDRSTSARRYLAKGATGSWHARLQTGTTIQRAQARDLVIPLMPVSGMGVAQLTQVAVSFVREHPKLMTAQTTYLQRIILDALRYNVPPGPSDFVGLSGHHPRDDIKGAQ